MAKQPARQPKPKHVPKVRDQSEALTELLSANSSAQHTSAKGRKRLAVVPSLWTRGQFPDDTAAQSV